MASRTRRGRLALKHQGHLSSCCSACAIFRQRQRRAAQTCAASSSRRSPAPRDRRRDAATRAAALDALGWTRRDAATFDLLAREVKPDADAGVARRRDRVAAAHPRERLARGGDRAAGARHRRRRGGHAARIAGPSRDAFDAIQFGEKLAASCRTMPKRAVRRDLRALGVQVVRIQTIPEKLSFDLNWFVVEAGKPVQIVLFNPDAMPHNLIVGQPGSLEAIGTAGRRDADADRPEAKAFVPDMPGRALLDPAAQRGRDRAARLHRAEDSRANTSTSARFPATGSACTASCSSSTISKRGRRNRPCRPIPMTKQPFTPKQP